MQSYLIGRKFGTREFLRSLIMNPSSKFRNSKWRIKRRNLLDWDEICNSMVFGVADYEFAPKIHKLDKTDPIWLTKIQKVN